MLEHKQLKNMAFTESNSSCCLSTSVENKLLEEQPVAFSVAVNQDIYKKAKQEFSRIL